MGSEYWKLTGEVAELEAGEFAAKLDTPHPIRGLTNARPILNSAVDGRLFQLAINGVADQMRTDAHVRLGDLTVNYGRVEDCPFAVQILWRYCPPNKNECDTAGGIDVCVSAQTSLLSAQPEIKSQSDVSCSEAYQLQDTGFEPFEANTVRLSAHRGKGCFLFRGAKARFSYVEMVHPLDFGHSEFAWRRDRTLGALTHLLLNRWMEKGVIVRSRMRGLFVDRRDDMVMAASAYQNFCEAELPLSA